MKLEITGRPYHAFAEGTVSVDEFFDELDARIKQWFDEHPEERNNPHRVNE